MCLGERGILRTGAWGRHFAFSAQTSQLNLAGPLGQRRAIVEQLAGAGQMRCATLTFQGSAPWLSPVSRWSFAWNALQQQTTPDGKKCVKCNRRPKHDAGHLQDRGRIHEENRYGRVVNQNANKQSEQ
jgi:hypothetical protein